MEGTNNGHSCYGVCVFVIVFCYCCFPCRGQDDPCGYHCDQNNCVVSNRNPNKYRQELTKNIETVLNHLVNASWQPAAFNISIVGQGNNTIYGLFQCRGDQTADQCLSCARNANNTIQKCSQTKGPTMGAAVWQSTCFMQFETQDFTGRLNQASLIENNDTDTVLPDSFDKAKKNLLTNLNIEAASSVSTRYAANSSSSDGNLHIYGLVQCWRDISTEDCRSCLDTNLNMLVGFSNGSKAAIRVTRSCFTQYDTLPFFKATASAPAPATAPSSRAAPAPASASASGRDSPEASDGSKDGNNVPVILGAIGGSVLLVILIGFLFWMRKKMKLSKKVKIGMNFEMGTSDAEEDDGHANDEDKIKFTPALLMIATNYFREDLKLGQGAFGAVYKGTLPNGRDIAVKKLLFRSSQGNKEFRNEIRLLVQIQHRNLVTLLGCCVDGPQRFLVYEYLCNRSLDKIIFDSTKKIYLNWPQRFHVIVGVAKGLLYLHEDSKLKIIHRDIKAANILLDNKFNPKIADFGLAKLFPEDVTKIQTKVAGTYGYLAPEYAMKGQLSTKADVYSFGIVILEVISGRKNGDFDISSGHNILTKVWNLFQQGNVEDIVDESITANSSDERVMRCIHVGLLCRQADSLLRPPMSTVLSMLTNISIDLPSPEVPAFLSFSSDRESTSEDGNQTSVTFPR